MSDNYMYASRLEAEHMQKKYREAREKWVMAEVAFITFLIGAFIGALLSQYPAVAIVLVALTIVIGVAGEYWRREMRKWDY